MADGRFLSTLLPLLVAVLVGPALIGFVVPGSTLATLSGAGPAPRQSTSAPLTNAVETPSGCAQGTNVIQVPPSTRSLTTALLNDYDQIGAEGGGTIELEAGTFVLPSMLVFKGYSNVSIEGAGVGKTILSMPSDPVGTFKSNTGATLGRWNYTLDRAVDGTVVDFLRVDGPTPINNFEMCDLTLRGEANNASQDWDGSFLFDSSGGHHHVYENLALTGFYGPSTIPNGIHLESFSNTSRAIGYLVDNVTADNNTLPFTYNAWVVGGPNFLNIGSIVNCTVDNLTAIGLLAFEVAPPTGCLIENVHVSGHLLIDPVVGGSWGNTLFQNVTIDSRGTAAPNAMGASVPNPQGNHGYSNFTAMRWNHCSFYGNVLNGKNMIDVENSSFYGGINETPSIFTGNYVNMTEGSPNYINLPIQVDGVPLVGQSSNFSGNTFIFPNSTFRQDPFVLHVPLNSWWNDTIEIAGRSTGYLFRAPGVTLAKGSVFSGLSYLSLGNNSPSFLTLMDLQNSPGFVDLGATVGSLSQILDNLPQYAPTPPTGLRLLARNATAIQLAWNSSEGNVTNYTVYAGPNGSALNLAFSAGLGTNYRICGLQPATAYSFEVVAWNSSFPSAPSDAFQASTEPLPQYAPGVPTGLEVIAIGTTSVGLSWTASTGNVTNYSVLLGLSTSEWSQRISVGLVLDYNVGGLQGNTTYFFAVVAWNVSWSSPSSAPVSATTLPSTSPPTGTSPPPGPAPGAPPPATTSPSIGLVLSTTDRLILAVIVAGGLAVVLGVLAGFSIRQARGRRRRSRHPSRSGR